MLTYSSCRSIAPANSEPVIDPPRRVVETILSGVGIFRRGLRAIGVGADAGHGAFDDDEIFVGAL